jgi:hypothetical protein
MQNSKSNSNYAVPALGSKINYAAPDPQHFRFDINVKFNNGLGKMAHIICKMNIKFGYILGKPLGVGKIYLSSYV